MSPIFVPPQPVPIIRQQIRNQADIQEQLRAYNRQQQDLVGANAAAFDATNIDKRVLFPMKLTREGSEAESKAAFLDEPEPAQQFINLGDVESLTGFGEEESKQAESMATQLPAPPSLMSQLTAETILEGEERPERALRPPMRPPRAPSGGMRVDQLKDAIRATGMAPVGLSSMRKAELQAVAKELGIDPF
jgi:hypothetical protein